VYSGKSSGTTIQPESYAFSASGRFVGVMVNGNTQNAWASITEFRAWGAPAAIQPVFAPAPILAPEAPATTTPGTDVFGVKMIHPTKAGGREWSLPNDADLNGNPEFVPETRDITVVQRGAATVYRTQGNGSDAQVRLNIHSPAGKAWWRNVEMTGYFRWTRIVGSSAPHWEMEARGERHSSSAVTKARVNDGVGPPAGTVTWPWWSAVQSGDVLNPHALGTAYHGNLYADASHGDLALFEKEITHTAGYASQRGGITSAPGLPPVQNRWFGYKFVVRNDVAATRVTLELWVDPDESGAWTKVSEVTDQNGVGKDWAASATSLDGATAAPYSYALNELITWAGPWVSFRSDNMEMEFKKLSVREIDPN
jgi:hypothetical protein